MTVPMQRGSMAVLPSRSRFMITDILGGGGAANVGAALHLSREHVENGGRSPSPDNPRDLSASAAANNNNHLHHLHHNLGLNHHHLSQHSHLHRHDEDSDSSGPLDDDDCSNVKMTNVLILEEEYLSSLNDLNGNSKPLINMLTILAEENIEHGQVIVDAIEKHITKISPDVKLPALYLIDSIVKNVGNEYVTLFSRSIVNIFCSVFAEVNEMVRGKMFSLRQTWNNVFPQAELYALDIKINALDPRWRITAKVTRTIHVNPNFYNSKTPDSDILRNKQRKLLELRKRKLELELAATKKHIAEQEKQLQAKTANVTTVSTTVVQPDNRTNVAAESSNLNFTTVVQRQRDPRLARQMQFQNAAQRNFPQRNRVIPPAPGIQRFDTVRTSFVSNNQLDSSVPLAEGEKKMKVYTIPSKKRSPSPKDKSTKSITAG